MNTQGIEEQIKTKARRLGAAAVGIADVSAINAYAPEGYRPDNLLQGARSVIVVAGAPTFAGAWKGTNARYMGIMPNFPTVRRAVTTNLANFFEVEHGYEAVQYDAALESGFTPFLSLKLCAEMAGLGTRALAGGVVLNGSYGLLSLAAVITTMPLKADQRPDRQVCPHPACVRMWEKRRTTPCLSSCEALAGELEAGQIKWMRYNRQLCATRCQNTSVGAFQKMLCEIINELNPEKRKLLIFSDFFGRTIRAIAFGSELVAQCWSCLKSCPVCRPNRSAAKIIQLPKGVEA